MPPARFSAQLKLLPLLLWIITAWSSNADASTCIRDSLRQLVEKHVDRTPQAVRDRQLEELSEFDDWIRGPARADLSENEIEFAEALVEEGISRLANPSSSLSAQNSLRTLQRMRDDFRTQTGMFHPNARMLRQAQPGRSIPELASGNVSEVNMSDDVLRFLRDSPSRETFLNSVRQAVARAPAPRAVRGSGPNQTLVQISGGNRQNQQIAGCLENGVLRLFQVVATRNVSNLASLCERRAVARGRPEVIERFGSADEAAATANRQGLVPRPGHERGDKWVAQEGLVNPSRLGSPGNYTHQMRYEMEPGTIEWLRRNGLELKPDVEPNRYAIPPHLREEFNRRVRRVETGPRPRR